MTGKRMIGAILMAIVCMATLAQSQVQTLQVTVNQDWLSPAVMRLGTDDVLNVSFDELSHQYHRYLYRLEHCEADWTPSEDIFESDWLEGFNDNTIDDYEQSLNTTIPYTHYRLQIPNDRCQLKMSGNYRLHIYDGDDDDAEVLTTSFMVTEQTMSVAMSVTTNTDIDTHDSHQQLSMSLNFGSALITNPEEQIKTVVMQNGLPLRFDVRPNFRNANGLEWQHNRQLIFDGGNEYHKFEVLDVTHPTMGIDYIRWDGANYQVFPYTDEPRPNYLYDEDADGAFYIRNSDNQENETTCEYVWVNYRLNMPKLPEGEILIDGKHIQGVPMTYDDLSGLYEAKVLQKQGYYNYRYLWKQNDGSIQPLPAEGNFYQTENRYQALVYFKGTGQRTWRLVAYRQMEFRY